MAVGLYTKDIKKSLDFYRNVLKIKVETEDLENDFVQLKIGDTSIALLTEPTLDAMAGKKFFGSKSKEQNFLIAVEVSSVKETVKKLEKKDVEIIIKPKTTPWGQKVAYFKDLNGYIWELSEPFEE